jgi:hypothetical protein
MPALAMVVSRSLDRSMKSIIDSFATNMTMALYFRHLRVLMGSHVRRYLSQCLIQRSAESLNMFILDLWCEFIRFHFLSKKYFVDRSSIPLSGSTARERLSRWNSPTVFLRPTTANGDRQCVISKLDEN